MKVLTESERKEKVTQPMKERQLLFNFFFGEVK
jgi:hypothetical protein